MRPSPTQRHVRGSSSLPADLELKSEAAILSQLAAPHQRWCGAIGAGAALARLVSRQVFWSRRQFRSAFTECAERRRRETGSRKTANCPRWLYPDSTVSLMAAETVPTTSA